MPKNSKAVGKGGIRGIKKQDLLKAPKGKFRLVGVDAFSGGKWVLDDFMTLEMAWEYAQQNTKAMMRQGFSRVYVVDDKGNNVPPATV